MEVGGQLRASAALPPEEKAPLPREKESGWTPEPVLTRSRRQKSSSLVAIPNTLS
jgi:hypothetical protein